MPEASNMADILSAMAPISIAEMDAVKLMNRIDTKYVTTQAVLMDLLRDAASAGYRVLEADGARISPYDSVYYDTPALKSFYDHRNKRLVRQKVRTRQYCSGETFLEIKRKNNHGRTKKKRCPIPAGSMMDFRGDKAATDYLASHSDYTAEVLTPSLETIFRRITLVNAARTERLTIDMDLCFKNLRTGIEASLKDAVIIELKQDGRAASEMKGILLNHRIHPFRVSKYCIGVSLTDPGVIPGRFKEKIRGIEKIIDKKI